MENKMIGNRYLIGNKLGQGGFSEVFEATDMYSKHYGDNRFLAIKVPLNYISQKTDIDAFFYNEFSCLTRLSHPNVIKIFDFGIDSECNIPYIVLERIEGKLLSNIAYHTMALKEKVTIAQSLIEAIAYLHKNNIVHADINPNNIMILNDGTVKLFDFGISINTKERNSFELNYSALKAFNPIYASPEVIEGQNPSKASDVFSFGVVLFQLFKTVLPYHSNSTELKKTKLSYFNMLEIPFMYRRLTQSALSYKWEKRKNLELFNRSRCGFSLRNFIRYLF